MITSDADLAGAPPPMRLSTSALMAGNASSNLQSKGNPRNSTTDVMSNLERGLESAAIRLPTVLPPLLLSQQQLLPHQAASFVPVPTLGLSRRHRAADQPRWPT
eukprot:CAMPEP_0178456944 /NCGR_PEP_ID=MMETSP0689_2-20121128/46757_1 /TAXON_ID=160604 /ORGANISM="Amphidinium massartii, Strain CS-259" /LENGTH=103 /DNA_ID=CAMNT_0020083169 /DNA_START=564 /DNA_END=872 /DNA_ORIENTATION=-